MSDPITWQTIVWFVICSLPLIALIFWDKIS